MFRGPALAPGSLVPSGWNPNSTACAIRMSILVVILVHLNSLAGVKSWSEQVWTEDPWSITASTLTMGFTWWTDRKCRSPDWVRLSLSHTHTKRSDFEALPNPYQQTTSDNPRSTWTHKPKSKYLRKKKAIKELPDLNIGSRTVSQTNHLNKKIKEANSDKKTNLKYIRNCDS